MPNKQSAGEWLTIAKHDLTATAYYVENRYPNAFFTLPTKQEIRQTLDFTNELFERICNVLEIEQTKL